MVRTLIARLTELANKATKGQSTARDSNKDSFSGDWSLVFYCIFYFNLKKDYKLLRVIIMAEGKKNACGLCGKTKKLIKTECCNNWICDDEHKYVLLSYARNSCHRNHRRYTVCGVHHSEEHEGEWQDCEECKASMTFIDYIDDGTNVYNFEKLQNPPKITITCRNCGFTSGTKLDFPVRVGAGVDGFYCAKEECRQKAAATVGGTMSSGYVCYLPLFSQSRCDCGNSSRR